MLTTKNTLGIDIGSVSISIAELTPDKKIIKTAYLFHQGNIIENLEKILKPFNFSGISAIASTSSTPSTIEAEKRYNNQVAVIAAARHLHNRVGSILIVGGEKFGLVLFDDQGNYLNSKTNTSCAAGTGSFLDQQAGRLNLSGIEELSAIASQNTGKIPKIASRCAVFAKTDLIHAQQEGFSFDEISDGLCHGLARNIVDTLFSRETPNTPLIFCGGVSKNKAVARHISEMIDRDIIVDDLSHVYGAIGAALNLIDETRTSKNSPDSKFIENRYKTPSDIIHRKQKEKKYYFEPLELRLSDYPDFSSFEQYEYPVKNNKDEQQGIQKFVEVDIYEELTNTKPYDVYMGIDIGSTSTKAALIDRSKNVLIGVYTRTAGRPVSSLCALFEAIDDIILKKQLKITFLGTGTTGSGRKFVGKIINAGIVVDEITAHARAAYELNPDVDTIIEIGGQDAKFTTLRNGMVTSSVMNNVCAAGTGSFIEEQAQKLGCSIYDFPKRTKNQKAPICSDRCTVFMERDINHHLSEGFSVDEVLASVLHSVRQNYLVKVATEANIGNTIFFQGATAKNRVLVAAFEQRLNKPILVSKYCHLTGAIGTALTLMDDAESYEGFRGIEIYKKDIPIETEVCELCTNHCKITIAEMSDEKVAYGFLCGRDYDTKKYVNNNLANFDLIKERRKAFAFKPLVSPSQKETDNITIGIPAALYLLEDVPFWKKFFDLLSIKTVTSEHYKEGLKKGKNITEAEFCAPITAMHGHAKYLLEKADYVFLPYYLAKKAEEKGVIRQYCYYSWYLPTMIASGSRSEKDRFLSPVIRFLYSEKNTKRKLFDMLKPIVKNNISFSKVSSAYDGALEFADSGVETLKAIYENELKKKNDINVMILGRPYTVLSPSMNNQIPDIFASLGVKTFFQDMLTYTIDEVEAISPVLEELHWTYAAKIMKSADIIAKTEGVYPVLMTSFQCSPDSFVIEYFKKLMDLYEKPYLILQLDEYDSSVGYETRIESAIRSFRNHSQSKNDHKNASMPVIKKSMSPEYEKDYKEKAIVYPNWDNYTHRLIVSIMKNRGYNTYLMEQSESAIIDGLKYNTGQCLPINTMAQGYIECIEKNNLDPEKTVLYQLHSDLPCNNRLFPYHIKTILSSYGNGMSKAGVMSGKDGEKFFMFSLKDGLEYMLALILGGLIRKTACKIRPYEIEKGLTDQVVEKSLSLLEDTLLHNRSKKEALHKVIEMLEKIEIKKETRPKVVIFGDLFARENDVLNQHLEHFIEDNGGEAISFPYSNLVKLGISNLSFRNAIQTGTVFNLLFIKSLFQIIERVEKKYYAYFEKVLGEPNFKFNEPPQKILSEYNMVHEQCGESLDNILKIFYLTKRYPDISLFVQTTPSLCCASLVTEAIEKKIEEKTGVPAVTITYDGTGGRKNDIIIPYLKYPRN